MLNISHFCHWTIRRKKTLYRHYSTQKKKINLSSHYIFKNIQIWKNAWSRLKTWVRFSISLKLCVGKIWCILLILIYQTSILNSVFSMCLISFFRKNAKQTLFFFRKSKEYTWEPSSHMQHIANWVKISFHQQLG